MEESSLVNNIRKVEIQEADQQSNESDQQSGESTNTSNRQENVEKPTLTDHLNKKLLESFLQHINEGSVSVPENRDIDIANKDEFA